MGANAGEQKRNQKSRKKEEKEEKVMKAVEWMKKGILCGVAALCLVTGTGTIRAEAGWKVTAAGQETAAKPEEVLKKKREELSRLRNTTFDYLVKCTYCNGSGRSQVACKKCNGKGIVNIPGDYYLVVSCGYCMRSGREACGMCMGGQMVNPEYNALCQERNERIKGLEAEIAQLEQQIRPKETQPAQDRNQNTGMVNNGGITNNGGTWNPGYGGYGIFTDDNSWGTGRTNTTIDCAKCNNTGWVDCSLCRGTGRIETTKHSIDLVGNGGTAYTTSKMCTSCTGGKIPCYLCSGRR